MKKKINIAELMKGKELFWAIYGNTEGLYYTRQWNEFAPLSNKRVKLYEDYKTCVDKCLELNEENKHFYEPHLIIHQEMYDSTIDKVWYVYIDLTNAYNKAQEDYDCTPQALYPYTQLRGIYAPLETPKGDTKYIPMIAINRRKIMVFSGFDGRYGFPEYKELPTEESDKILSSMLNIEECVSDIYNVRHPFMDIIEWCMLIGMHNATKLPKCEDNPYKIFSSIFSM